MKYLKNVEAANIYHVSEKSVRNWVEAARSGKLTLELHEENGKHYIANTTKNQTLIRELVARGQKYKNRRALKTVSPRAEFYELFSPEQIFDIFSSIDIYREIPLQYTYFDGGAEQWDLFAQRLMKEDALNILTNTINLIEKSHQYIGYFVENYDAANVIDLGVGNAAPVRKLLEYLLQNNKLNRYIGIDTSEEMLKIAHRNVDSWFGKKINFEKFMKDMTSDRFDHTVATDAFGHQSDSISNLVMLLGGTLSNQRRPDQALQIIRESMGRNDLLIYTGKLDSKVTRRYFDFGVRSKGQTLNPRHRIVPDLLNIDESLYKVEQFFDPQKMARFIQIRLKVDLTIEFDMYKTRKHIALRKDDCIILWRARHWSTLDIINQFDTAGFDLLHASKTPDQEYLLTISKVKTETPSSPKPA